MCQLKDPFEYPSIGLTDKCNFSSSPLSYRWGQLKDAYKHIDGSMSLHTQA